MLNYDFEASVGYWITMTAHAYQQQLNDELAPYGITFRQFQVLAWLVYQGDLAPSELAQRLMVEPPTLAGILDRMQREGWIERRPCDRDRRRRLVTLTAGAKPVWRQVVACLRAMRARATAGMSDKEVETLNRLLQRVQSNLHGHRPQASPPSRASAESMS